MNPRERLYRLHELFSSTREPLSLARLCEELECSPATVKRMLSELRNDFGAPIENIRGQGWRYRRGARFELPGVWFSPQELAALLTLERVFEETASGRLARLLAPLRKRWETLKARFGWPELSGRVRDLTPARRLRQAQALDVVVEALIQRRRLCFAYRARKDEQETQREVSPQRLVLYRGNWYLDAFCHLRKDLRTFALDRMHQASLSLLPAKQLALDQVEAALDCGYGIFAGAPKEKAVLRFSAGRARWVADELWHPEQQGRWLEDGSYELVVPYSDPTELVLDICRYGPDVEVIAPEELRREVARRLEQAALQYRDKKGSGFEPEGI